MSEHDMELLLELVERALGPAWREVVEHLRDTNDLDDIAERIHHGDIDGAVQGVEDAAAAFAAATHDAYITSGQTAASWLDDALEDKLVRFDVANHRAAAWANTNKLDTIREITQEQRDLIRRVHADGVAAGLNPREIARDIRDSIGLTDYQAQIVANYRTALEAGDSNALDRELTDGRDDRTVAAALRDGRSLTPAQIDKMVERYRSNWVDYRATTIACTESLRVAHQGSRELFKQAIDAGHVEADQLEREWHHTRHGKAPRADHEEMNGQTRGIDEPFESGSGAQLMFPGDPNADISETAGCSCAVSTRLVA